MRSKSTLVAKLGLVSSFLLASFLVCGLPIFVMQSVSIYKASYGAAGALESYQNIPMVIVSFIVFSYIMKIGYKRSLVFISLFMAVVCMIMPMLNSFWAVKLYLILAGSAFVCLKITIYSTITLVTSDKKGHASFMSILEGIFMFGTMIGMWIFSAFITSNWLYTFWVFAAFALVNVFLWQFISLNESEVEKAKEQSIKDSYKGIKHLICQKSVIFYIFILIIYALIEQGAFSWLPNYNNEVLSLPKAISVTLGSFMIGFIAVGRIFGGILFKYIKWEKVLIIYFILGIVLIGFTAFSLRSGLEPLSGKVTLFNIPWQAYSIPLLGFLIGPVIPLINSSALTCLPKYMHAEMITLMVIISALASSFASRLLGGMFSWVGGQAAFNLITIVPLAILLIVIVPYSIVLRKTEEKLKLEENTDKNSI